MNKFFIFLLVPFLSIASLQARTKECCGENYYIKAGSGAPQFANAALGYRTFSGCLGYDFSLDGFIQNSDYGLGVKALQLYRVQYDCTCDFVFLGFGFGANGLANKSLSYLGPERSRIDVETKERVRQDPERINPWVQGTLEFVIGQTWTWDNSWTTFLQCSLGKVFLDGRKIGGFPHGWRFRVELGVLVF